MEYLIAGYGYMFRERVRQGWRLTFLTFTFNHLRGSASNVAWQMRDELERVYAKVLTRIERKPRNVPPDLLPLWVCCPDFPVSKTEKHSFRDAVVNNGRHVHAIAAVPPWSRMKGTLEDHFYEHQNQYTGNGKPLFRIDAQPITHDGWFATDYGLKGAKSSRVGYDELFILPRSTSEVPVRTKSVRDGDAQPRLTHPVTADQESAG
ncbi:hypothetical protein [Mesorhizobium sp. M7A.F.Ca.US.010.02.1.1]|uniref:hypothetical protein n=1 Tax=Mesorhizobium sp. M7A.F.Ca.US.010.02.1.1 TaxID=2496743 RepID=UPI000FD4711A|nr:hypothetical protein [Mesorhizobium sp. M7A.F.Ca.US.010.02.1.1]RUW89171.1 hypothetical protein EOA19_26110 [Mesorhizobium sp. M7A.F.Ca.US.010.02.1.1]